MACRFSRAEPISNPTGYKPVLLGAQAEAE